MNNIGFINDAPYNNLYVHVKWSIMGMFRSVCVCACVSIRIKSMLRNERTKIECYCNRVQTESTIFGRFNTGASGDWYQWNTNSRLFFMLPCGLRGPLRAPVLVEGGVSGLGE